MLLWLAVYMTHAVLLLPFSVPGLLSFRLSYGLVAPVVCVEGVSLWFLVLHAVVDSTEGRSIFGGGLHGGKSAIHLASGDGCAILPIETHMPPAPRSSCVAVDSS